MKGEAPITKFYQLSFVTPAINFRYTHTVTRMNEQHDYSYKKNNFTVSTYDQDMSVARD